MVTLKFDDASAAPPAHMALTVSADQASIESDSNCVKPDESRTRPTKKVSSTASWLACFWQCAGGLLGTDDSGLGQAFGVVTREVLKKLRDFAAPR